MSMWCPMVGSSGSRRRALDGVIAYFEDKPVTENNVAIRAILVCASASLQALEDIEEQIAVLNAKVGKLTDQPS